MATLQCQTCRGIYDDVLPDGMRYFHACPPLSDAELAAAVQSGTITLRKGESVADAMQRRTWPRPNARNENVDPVKVRAARTPDGKLQPGKTDADLMQAPGAGVTLAPVEAADVV